MGGISRTQLITPIWRPNTLTQQISQDVHIFKIQVAGQGLPNVSREELKSILTKDEIRKIENFKRQTLQENFLRTRYYLRKILSMFLNCEPEKLLFKINKGEKPQIDGINYNLTRSGDYVIIAVSEQIIGIDLEKIRRDFDFIEISRQHFHYEELEWTGNDHDRFYIIWTRKEAVLKATGEGLTDYMSNFNTICPSVHQTEVILHLTTYSLIDNYTFSLVKENPDTNTFFWQIDSGLFTL